VKEKELRNVLLEQPIPDEHFAEERSWDAVRQAFATRERLPRERRVPWKLLLVAAIVGGGIAVGVTPAGSEVADWVRDRLGRDRVVETPADAAPAPLAELPAPGRILVTAPSGVWVLNADGTKRRIGDFKGATWSPAGKFIAVWDESTLAAVDPAFTVPQGIHWDLAGEQISGVQWSLGEGFRVSYLAGSSLRVVTGNGEGDRELVERVAPVTPVWKPTGEHVLAYADPQGRVVVVNVDTGKVQWRTARAPVPVALAWTADGKRLAVLTEQSLRIFEAPRKLVREVKIPKRLYTATTLAVRPESQDVAYAVYSSRTAQGTVFLHNGSFARPLFSGGGRFDDLVWAPDGELLLIPWQTADQWLFVPPDDVGATVAHAGISAELSPGDELAGGFPRLAGWVETAGGE
jgi:hypothetical protein